MPTRSGSRSAIGAGGARAFIAPTQYTMPAISYQSHAETLAARRAEFRELVQAAARNLRPYARTTREQSVCDEAARGHSLSIDGLAILCDLVARSERPFALEELIRGQVLRARTAEPATDVYDLNEAEQVVDAEADLIQMQAAREKCRTRLQQLTEVGPRMIAMWRRLTDAAHHALARPA